MQIDPADIAICVTDEEAGGPLAPVPTSAPIVQTSLFSFPTFGALVDAFKAEHRHNVYTRGQNPTVQAFEHKLAALERGEACKCFASGMAAISAVMLGLLRSGDHVLFVNQTYGPTLQLAEHLRRFGIEHDSVLDLEVDSVERGIRPNTRLIWLESPGTMLLRVLDLGAVTAFARQRSILTCVDNSWATPLCQKPLAAGADIVVHTCSKYLGGHSDVIAGGVVSTAERIQELFYSTFLLHGGVLGPFDAWLLLRGLRTLPVRLRQHESDALEVARFLSTHSAVQRVHHPAFAESTDLVQSQLTGYSGLFSFELADGDFESVSRVIDGLAHFRIGVSWGGVESVVISPNRGTNGPQLDAQEIPRGLIRLSVGLEGPDVLIEDLASALAGAR